MQEVQKKPGKMKKTGTVREIGGVVFIQFDKRKKKRCGRRVPAAVKEAAEGAVFGLLVLFMLLVAVEANACGADTELPQEYIRYCEEIGQAYHICPELLEAVIETESNGDPDAVGELGEIGLMQIYPKYNMDRAERLGVRYLFDPKGNILVGADCLAELFEEYGDPGTVLMLYNGTKGAADRGRQGDSTDYAEKVMKRAAQLERLHKK